MSDSTYRLANSRLKKRPGETQPTGILCSGQQLHEYSLLGKWNMSYRCIQGVRGPEAKRDEDGMPQVIRGYSTSTGQCNRLTSHQCREFD